MFAPKQKAQPTKKRTGILIEQHLLDRLDQIADTEPEVRSRNEVISTLLEFATEAYEGLRPVNDQVGAFREKEGCTYGQAVARLVARGLKAKR
jgi:hypothetical protein